LAIMSVEIHDVPARQRYEAVVDGTSAGFVVYRDHGGARVFTHAEVLPEFEGRGVGSALARGALDDVRAGGRSLVPQCAFIRAYIERQPEYGDLVDADLTARLSRG
jgi:uncharacterized protein